MNLKCPVNGCQSTSIKVVQFGGIYVLTCGEGHVISRDYTVEINSLVNAVSALSATVSGHVQAVRKDMTEAIKALSKKS